MSSWTATAMAWETPHTEWSLGPDFVNFYVSNPPSFLEDGNRSYFAPRERMNIVLNVVCASMPVCVDMFVKFSLPPTQRCEDTDTLPALVVELHYAPHAKLNV